MNRRIFLSSSALLGISALAWKSDAWAQELGNEPDPNPFGAEKLGIIKETADGNIIAMDSLLQIYDDRVTVNDVVIAASYAGAATLPHVAKKGAKALIAHDAGVGKDNAGISALVVGDEHGIPVAAVECFSASLSNGRSMTGGVISHVNDLARKLGVKPGQNSVEAAALLLKAAPGQPTEQEVPFDKVVHEMGSANGGKIYASSALTNLKEGGDYTRDVLAWGSHTGAIAVPIMKTRMLKGCVGNDCGKAKNNSGIGALPGLNEIGVLAATVSSASARIGDGVSTYQDGLISAANDLARKAGVRDGMPCAEAMRLMIEA